ncbi:MAG: GAF domain-containing protein, partial [Elainellaceae cyanobacterium]
MREDRAAESGSTHAVSDDLSAFSSQAPPTQELARLQVLFRIQNSPNLQALFQTTATELRALLNASRVGVFRFDPDSNWSQGSFISEDAAAGYGSALAIQLEEPCFGAQFAVHYQKGRVRAVEDVYNAGLTPCYIQFLDSLRIRANLTVPLLNQDRLWGLLCVQQCDRPRCWQSWEIKFVQQIGTQLSIALRQGECLQQIQNQVNQQAALIQAISKIHHCSNLDAALTVAVTETRRLLNADRVGIFRFHSASDWDRGEFVAESIAAGYASTLQIVVEDRCFGSQYAEHYQRGQIQAVADIYAAGLQDCHIDVLAQFDVRANLVIPLLDAGYLWGLLCVHQCDRPRQWQPQEIELAQSIATHLDIALEQADLMNRSRQQTQDLTTALNHLKAAQAQLVQSEKMSSLGQLVAGIAHEINNPVNFIYGNLTYLNDYCTHLLTLIRRYRDCCPDHLKQETARLGDEIELDFLIEDLPKIIGSVQIGAERIRDIVLSLQRFAH